MTTTKENTEVKLTQEQLNILDTLNTKDKIIKINAYAGSGKTKTIVELIKKIRETDSNSKILYLVFNRSMIQDAEEKLKDFNVDAQTTHGFALRRFSAIKKEDINILNNLDFTEFMKIKNRKEFAKSFIRYSVINNMLNAYCLTFDDLNTFCRNCLTKPELYSIDSNIPKRSEIDFFEAIYKHFLQNGLFTHGMYLKEYSLNCSDKIKYDYIFFDEAQDISMFALNIMNRMQYKKLYIVGDIYQNIYSFLKTVNAFNKLDGVSMPLSTSFRFNKRICNLANDVLSSKYDCFKSNIKNFHDKKVSWSKKEKTVLFRLNYTLLEYAVELVKNNKNIKVKFMDVVNGSNCYKFDDTFSETIYFYYKLLESLNSKDLNRFKEKFKIRTSKNIDTFVKIAEKQGSSLYKYLYNNKSILPLDLQKQFMFFTLNEHEIVDVLDAVRKSEDCENPNKTYVLITAHRSKGLEWDDVKIAKDDWKTCNESETNLLYVAITRARYNLDIRAIEDLLDSKGIFVDKLV